MMKKYFTFSHFTLFVALCISAIAAWYSVIGLTAIFAGAVIPIIIMGGILEVAKITTTVWLHKYWDRAGVTIKTYLTIAVVALACLTSMGIFGLLSKAHSDQSVVSGDVVAKVSLIDEKIKIQRDNIEAARRALAQMDAQVDQRLSRSDSEQGAERAVQIRRQQARERTALQNEIAVAQREIAKLNEERAPIASQLRKVEAEVGPVKYIAALIYGDNPDSNLLERAVRWVTILIVTVFDPLAIVLILAANNSLKWEREKREKLLLKEESIIKSEIEAEEIKTENINEDDWKERISKIENSTPWPTEWNTDNEDDEEDKETKSVTDTKQKSSYSQTDYAVNYKIEPSNINLPVSTVADESLTSVESKHESDTIETDNVTKEAKIYHEHDGYVLHDGKMISVHALKELISDAIITSNKPSNEILFGNKFPTVSKVGDIYTRIDVMPHSTYKFNGSKWIQIDRNKNVSYLQNVAYVQYLISKLDSGEYDLELLTTYEQEEIAEYLKRTS
jgi:hypothetical protein